MTEVMIPPALAILFAIIVLVFIVAALLNSDKKN